MRHSARLFGLMAGTALIVSVSQFPGLSGEFRHLTAQAVAQTTQADDPATVLLEVEGVLEAGDATLDDGSLYDAYTLAGKANQTLAITLESLNFDTFLLVLDKQGNEIARNDDIDTEAGNYHSFVTVTLPADGTYRVLANGRNASSRGRYRLIAVQTPPGQATPALTTAAMAEVEANQLLQQGIQQFNVSQFREALQSWEQALDIYREIGDRAGEGGALVNLGSAYYSLGDYQQAIDFYEQRLAIAREIGDRAGEGKALGGLGNAYLSLGDYQQAIDLYEQQLVITREIGDRAGEGNALNNLGEAYRNLGDYQQAIDLYEQALALFRELGGRAEEGGILGNLGIAYANLGDYQQAIDLYEQQLVITREIGDRAGEGRTLGNLGIVYRNLGDYQQAIDFYEQSLAIAREIGDRAGEGRALGNLGIAYANLGDYQQAIDFYEQSLAIAREIGDRAGEGITLGNLGIVYDNLGDYPQAIDFYEQSLAIARAIGDRAGEGSTLGNLGKLLADQNQQELAIVFLKSSVAVRESIRGGIRELDTDLQQSYTDTVAGTYRFLADLLLEAGRIPEAQQVLDLLKIEELREFTDIRATWTGTELAYTDLEEPVAEAHTDLIAFGQKLYECQQTNCAELSDLLDEQEALIAAYNDEVSNFEAVVRQRRADDPLFQDPDNLSGAAQDLLAANPNSVLIYPFVTADKLWLLWAAGSAVGSVQVDVTQGEISSTVQRFGELLTSGGNLPELQATSQQLYGWLIEPLEAELQANGIEQLIFVNDRVTRYIPMAALWDGEQFLIERYTLSTVISPELTDTEDRLTGIDESQVLGLGLSQPVSGFNPLPAVEPELDNIILSGATDATGIYPGQLHLNEAFTLEQLKDNVLNHRVLHIASHAAFVPGRKEDSFILLGDGQKLRVTDIDDMSGRLGNLHMVVLSACQTALGGEAGDGTEIAGISSYFLKTGRAETVIASLWAVNDTSTSLLMQRFYELLASGELTKAEALRQAQLSLLYDEDTETRLAASRATIDVESRDGQNSAMTGFQHPYHWAPFILIGNGL
jgi:CHAT domain-containing protein/Tfp pilus assembly protein PilF